MNILYYLKSFPKISESFILNEIYALEQAGHNVAVFALGQANGESIHPEYGAIEAPIKYAGMIDHSQLLKLVTENTVDISTITRRLASNPSLHELAILLRTKQCIEFVKELEWEIDVIHTHFATKEKLACHNIASYFDVPFTLTTHAFDIYREAGRCTEQLLEDADRVVTISEYNRNYMKQVFGSQTPIDVVRAGIRGEKFTASTTPATNRILTVARHKEKKGLHDALKAVSIAARQVPDLEYHLIGSGPLSDELVEHTNDLGIEEHVSFLDNVTDDRLIEEYDRARCFLLPCVITDSGERDGIPVVLMEAMAMETPPISTPVSGIPELIDHEQNGLLVKPRRPEGIARELVRLMQNDSEWNEYRRQGRAKVIEEFNILKEVHKLEQTFEATQRNQTTSEECRYPPPRSEKSFTGWLQYPGVR